MLVLQYVTYWVLETMSGTCYSVQLGLSMYSESHEGDFPDTRSKENIFFLILQKILVEKTTHTLLAERFEWL